MTYSYIKTEIKDKIGMITINRPEVRNALHLDTLKEIEFVLESWRNNDDVLVVIFTGAGDKSFAAGADIVQLQKRTMLEALQPNMTATYRKIEEYEKATIAAINGFALGGGLELALACDIRIASTNAKLGLPELNLAIIPGAGGTQRLSRLIGKGKAIEMILTGDIVTASQAEEIGLISKAVLLEELMEEAKLLAAKILKKGPLAVRLAKTVIHQGADLDMGTALLLEKFAQTILMGSQDKNEGTQAFLEKRVPEFTGK
ncbi:enoyl-CoA hydratase/isomerase family protein [Cytobacillus depressus]|uniref:Enoyl-CoA hydratase/isomerase family protein n=1 Tax=Cytobacillus depressus TaxID=1602942 RepID=A0A6L3V4L0_9BACI|nr:enoyl-CoA hydratase-related protein [Cytobacillus depressus]KAB2333269.1 enoyl-CoA hydratase/isomerase family protein [Cytobacillus depressus]